LQVKQEPHVATEQQAPSTQLPLAHSPPLLHVWPSGLALPHWPPEEHELGGRQSPFDEQVVLQLPVVTLQV